MVGSETHPTRDASWQKGLVQVKSAYKENLAPFCLRQAFFQQTLGDTLNKFSS
jgi:hypothetical protein